ncbi:hypothetical protein JVT61DRAFT_6768 [Boletus reticuloceps]|uniref:Uncharacterized protein n=1 Tax=Boletus reticuloceps TaxID=495285 RepID=A0A8I2YL12_9AGAM|nr:hypothetical protein JVT61DRAFT_6768 [Boletus reticuloceps]
MDQSPTPSTPLPSTPLPSTLLPWFQPSPTLTDPFRETSPQPTPHPSIKPCPEETTTKAAPADKTAVPQMITQHSEMSLDSTAQLESHPIAPLLSQEPQTQLDATCFTQPPHTPLTAPSWLRAHLVMATENCRYIANQFPAPHSDALLAHTPKPTNSFLESHLCHSAHLFDNMDKDSVAQWDEKVLGSKLLFRIFDFNANKVTPETIQTVLHSICKMITGITYEYQDTATVKIAPSTCAIDAKAAPTTFLINGLSLTLQTILLNTKVWATQDVTFEVFPFEPSFPTFIFALAGFVHVESQEAYSIILQTWNTDHMYDAYIRIITQDEHFPAETTEEAQVQWLTVSFHQLLDNLQVTFPDMKLARNIPATCFNIFVEIPKHGTKSMTSWKTRYTPTPYMVLPPALPCIHVPSHVSTDGMVQNSTCLLWHNH